MLISVSHIYQPPPFAIMSLVKVLRMSTKHLFLLILYSKVVSYLNEEALLYLDHLWSGHHIFTDASFEMEMQVVSQ